MRVDIIDHFKPCMTEIYLHIVARMADYMATHPGETEPSESDCEYAWPISRVRRLALVRSTSSVNGTSEPSSFQGDAGTLQKDQQRTH